MNDRSRRVEDWIIPSLYRENVTILPSLCTLLGKRIHRGGPQISSYFSDNAESERLVKGLSSLGFPNWIRWQRGDGSYII